MSTDLRRHALNGATMGTRWSALIYAPTTTDIAALEAALIKAVTLVDDQMSTWKPDSDLMRLNRAAMDIWVSLPPALTFVLNKGLEIGRATDGAFDIGMGELVEAWGFGAGTNTPDAKVVKSNLGKVRPATHELLELDTAGNRARKKAMVQLDLSGIAKGFGVDEMMRVLDDFAIDHALVGLDGELKAKGTKPDGSPWTVAVEKPDYEERSPMAILDLQDAAIATSGDYRHWVAVGETRLSHTMSRLQGGPVNNAVASVSVVTEACIDADAWATALLVSGSVEGPKLADMHNLNALFILRDGDALNRIAVGSVFVDQMAE